MFFIIAFGFDCGLDLLLEFFEERREVDSKIVFVIFLHRPTLVWVYGDSQSFASILSDFVDMYVLDFHVVTYETCKLQFLSKIAPNNYLPTRIHKIYLTKSTKPRHSTLEGGGQIY